MPGREASTVAYAAHCQQEDAYDRPIAGHTNICPGAIREGDTNVGLTHNGIKIFFKKNPGLIDCRSRA